MINFFIENAKQTVVRAKTAISRPVYTYWNKPTSLPGSYNTGSPFTPAEEPADTTGDGLPRAWE